MAVIVTTKELSKAEAKTWIADRGIERFPRKDEVLSYIPPCSYNEYCLERAPQGFKLTSHVLSS